MSKKNQKQIKVGDYEMVNHDKVERVINGVIGKLGQLHGGLGEDAPKELILAHYDRLGGFIKNKAGYKVQNGSFWDLKEKCPRKEPKVIIAFRDIEGSEVLVPEGKEKPIEVKAAEMAKEQKMKKEEKRRADATKKKEDK